VVAIFKRENFLNIGKKQNTLSSYQERREKMSFAITELTSFFLPHYGKKQTTKPALRSLRSLRLGKIILTVLPILGFFTRICVNSCEKV
jgi:hypothetical protein